MNNKVFNLKITPQLYAKVHNTVILFESKELNI